MKRHLGFAAVLVPAVVFCTAAAQASWIFRPSHYTHDPTSGRRVAQYAAKEKAYAPNDPTYSQSGYRHDRTTLRGADGSIDRRHVVETWGAGEAIRPYGEWQRPFRAGATPYGPWGNPSGPWTSPFGSWGNPYGLGKLPTPPWSPWYPTPYRPPYGTPVPYAAPGYSGYPPAAGGPPGHGGVPHP